MSGSTAHEGQGAEGYSGPNWGRVAAKLCYYQMPGEVPFLAVNHRAVGTAAQGSGRSKVLFSGVGQDTPQAGDGDK